VNIASPDSIQIHALLKVIERHMQKRGLIKYGAKPYSVNQIMNVTPNISKLLELGWTPKFDVETGIQRTIKSFLSKSSDIG
jgi:nucleoside-diphosphate-sugar epimerase